MDNKKTDTYYLSKIITDLKFLIAHTSDLRLDNFDEDEVLLDSIMFRLIQISENAARLTEEYRRTHTGIPWTAIRGLRNRIVHDYGEVDYKIVFDTVKTDIPVLLEKLSSCGK